MVSIYLHSNVSGALRKTILFLQEGRFSRSRSSKVINVGVNRKRICDFLLVRNGNFGPILHCVGDFAAFMCSWPHPYSTLFLRVFPLHQIDHVVVSESIGLKLFGREITDGRTDWRTDGQTTWNLIIAFCAASRGKDTCMLVTCACICRWKLSF